MSALARVGNETPTIGVAVVAVLHGFGVDVSDEDVDHVVRGIQAVVGFALWLIARASTDGPVTIAQRRKSDA